MFSTVVIPFDAYRDLPTPGHFVLLTALARYSDQAGRCFPSMRQLARDAKMSLATVCRRLADLSRLGVFQRERSPGRRYHYTLAESYRLRWPGKVRASFETPVPATKQGVPGAGTQEAKPWKQGYKQERFADELPYNPWPQRLRQWKKDGFWLIGWGPKPNEPGCAAPRL